MKKVLVLYHANCLDGFGAAFSAWLYFRNAAEYVAVNYNEPPPDVTEKHVYILDFSYKRPVLEQMAKDSLGLTVIDHHKTAMEDLAGFKGAYFDMSKSGAVLTWEHFFYTPVPKILLHVQDRDLWKFELEDTKNITAALHATMPNSFEVWESLLKDANLAKICAAGGILNLQFKKEVDDLVSKLHAIKIVGVQGFACNAPPKYASELGNRLAQQTLSFGAVYYYDGKRGVWQFSLRSVGDFDVSELAKQFGGGGHKNAAGFFVENISDFV